MSWYPDKASVSRLKLAVDTASKNWDGAPVSDDFLRAVSGAILQLPSKTPDSPYLMSDWIWITAQLRIAYSDQIATARVALSGLVVLIDLINSDTSLTTYAEYRWLTDYVVDQITNEVGPDAFGSYLTSDEVVLVEDRLLELAESTNSDTLSLISHAQKVAEELSGIHNSSYKPTISAKILHLCEMANDHGEAGYWSRAALRYLHQENDIINDSLGYIGLLDDIQVIEDVYELIHGRLSWKPLIDHGIRHWPIIARSYWMDGSVANHLPPFFQAVATCVLDAAFGQSEERVLIFPETGPSAVIAACLLAFVETDQTKGSSEVVPGTVLSFREGRHLRYAVVAEPFNFGEEKLPMLHLRDGQVSVTPRIISLMENVIEENPKLAKSAQLENWKNTVSDADLQTPMWGYRRSGERTSVLLVTDRNDFLSSIDLIQPFGRPVGELIPVSYITRNGRSLKGPNIHTASVSLVACNDSSTAESILRGCRERGQKPPRAVIIDRRIQPNQLAGVRYRCREIGTKLIRMATTDDAFIEKKSEKNPADVWFLRPGEIDPVPRSMSRSLARHTGDGSLARYLRRQIRARDIVIENIEVSIPAIAEFAEAARALQRHTKDDGDLLVCAVLSESVLRQLSCAPPIPVVVSSMQHLSLIDRLIDACSVNELFNKSAATLRMAADNLKLQNTGAREKYQALCNVLSNTEGAIHIVVSSRNVASDAAEYFSKTEYHYAKFIAVSDLYQHADCSLMIVPGWLGTLNMRLIQQGGWAPKIVRIFFNYEAVRGQALNRRLVNERQRFREMTNESWERLRGLHTSLGAPPNTSKKDKRQTALYVSQESTEVDKNKHHTDEIEDGWIETLVRDHVHGQQENREKTTEVKGHLIFFDDGQHYGIFAEGSALICINEFTGGEVDLDDVSDSDVENNIWKMTKEISLGDILAFPDDLEFDDVIQSIADGLLRDAGSTRKSARLWKDVLVDIARTHKWDLEEIQKLLSSAGVVRHVATISGWLIHGNSIAPRNPAKEIPAILSLSNKEEIKLQTTEVLKAVDRVYRARRDAARRLATLLVTQKISPETGSAYLTIGDLKVHYKLLTVSSVDESAVFDASVLGLYSMDQQARSN